MAKTYTSKTVDGLRRSFIIQAPSRGHGVCKSKEELGRIYSSLLYLNFGDTQSTQWHDSFSQLSMRVYIATLAWNFLSER